MTTKEKKKMNADNSIYTFTDEKGNKIEYKLNCARNRDYPEPYNITMAISCRPSSYDDKIYEDAKKYIAAHPEIKVGNSKTEILYAYVTIQANNHICDKALSGKANSWEKVYAQGMCIQPTFRRGTKLNLGTCILVSEDILNGKEPFANAVKNFEETMGKTASRNLDNWTTYPNKDALVKYFQKAELQEQKGEEITNPKASAQGYRIGKKYSASQGHKPEITPQDKVYTGTGEEIDKIIRDLVAKKSRE